MVLKNALDLGNGFTQITVLDCATGFLSNYMIVTGTLTQFMKELRQK